MLLLKNKYPKYFSYQGRKISKRLSQSKKDLISNYYNQFSLDQSIIEYHESKESNKKIELPNIFQKINIEIGFGNGDYLIKNAISKPNELFFGVEVYINGIAKVLEQILELGIKNIILSNLNCVYFLCAMPRKSTDKIFIINPDPWTKKRHHKRRLMSHKVIGLLSEVIKSKNSIYMTTDSELYLKDTLNLINEYKDYIKNYRCKALNEKHQLYGISRYQLKAIRDGKKIYLLTF